MSERKYFPINEGSARATHHIMSMRDYSEGSSTAEYHAAADKAYDLADKVAEKTGGGGTGLQTGRTLLKENGRIF